MDRITYRGWPNHTIQWVVMMVLGLTVGCSSPKSATSPPAPSPSVTLVPTTSPGVPTTAVTQQPTPPNLQSTAVPAPTAVATAPSQSAEPSPALPSDPTLINRLRRDLSRKVVIAKQDTGKTHLSSLLLSQQAEKLVKGQFSNDLKRLARDFPSETDEYRLEIRKADNAQAVIVAVAKQPGYASYTGAVYALEGKIPVTGICKTNVPSQMPPPAPKLVHSVLMCAAGSSSVNE